MEGRTPESATCLWADLGRPCGAGSMSCPGWQGLRPRDVAGTTAGGCPRFAEYNPYHHVRHPLANLGACPYHDGYSHVPRHHQGLSGSGGQRYPSPPQVHSQDRRCAVPRLGCPPAQSSPVERMNARVRLVLSANFSSKRVLPPWGAPKGGGGGGGRHCQRTPTTLIPCLRFDGGCTHDLGLDRRTGVVYPPVSQSPLGSCFPSGEGLLGNPDRCSLFGLSAASAIDGQLFLTMDSPLTSFRYFHPSASGPRLSVHVWALNAPPPFKEVAPALGGHTVGPVRPAVCLLLNHSEGKKKFKADRAWTEKYHKPGCSSPLAACCNLVDQPGPRAGSCRPWSG